MKNKERIKKIVIEKYSDIAKSGSCCCSSTSSCCSSNISKSELNDLIGYKKEDLENIPTDANLGLGCGNPVAFTMIKEGDVVIDLGSGAGIDCFLASKKVGSQGKVIGIDMTSKMIEKAKENAKKGNFTNVEFILGEIENLPVKENFANIVISNCVINLSPDKQKVFDEIYRVLKENGCFIVSDIVLLDNLPEEIKNSSEAYTACLAGAILKEEYIRIIENAGFKNIKVIEEKKLPINYFISTDDNSDLNKYINAEGIIIQGIK